MVQAMNSQKQPSEDYFGIEPILEEYLNPERDWKYANDVKRAINEFIGAPIQMPDSAFPFFADWFVFDYIAEDGRRILEKFVADNPTNLFPEIRTGYRDMLAENCFDFFDITRAFKRKVDLVRIRDGRTYTVRLPGKPHRMKTSDVLAGRIGKAGNEWWMLSFDPLAIARPSKSDRKRLLQVFPVPDSKFLYHEIVAPDLQEYLAPDMNFDELKIPGGTTLITGGDPHLDDGCPVCEYTKKLKAEGREPNPKELQKAFEEVNTMQQQKRKK
jgi:hypothetical protein